MPLVRLGIAVIAVARLASSNPCTIESPTSCDDFAQRFYGQRPAVFRQFNRAPGVENAWAVFAASTDKAALANLSLSVELSTACAPHHFAMIDARSNSYTGRVLKGTTVADYVASVEALEQDPTVRASLFETTRGLIIPFCAAEATRQ